MLAGEGGARLSLAGAKGKLPVVVADGAIAVPRIGEPTTQSNQTGTRSLRLS